MAAMSAIACDWIWGGYVRHRLCLGFRAAWAAIMSAIFGRWR